MREELEPYENKNIHGIGIIDDVSLIKNRDHKRNITEIRFLLHNIQIFIDNTKIFIDHVWVKCQESGQFLIGDTITFYAKIIRYKKFKDKKQWKRENNHFIHKKEVEYGFDEIYNIKLHNSINIQSESIIVKIN